MPSMISLEDFAAVRVALGQRVADAKFLARGRANVGPAIDSDGEFNFVCEIENQLGLNASR